MKSWSRQTWFTIGVAAIFLVATIQCILWIIDTRSTAQEVELTQQAAIGSGVQEAKNPVYPFQQVDFKPLQKQNTDIVSWLDVKAVGLSIPITQTGDNEFYLTHDVNKKSNRLGWVFADARSNLEHLGVNTVLYGHNAADRKMFGSLKGLLNTDESTVDANKIVTFTTPTKEYVFNIVSVYVTDYDDWKYVKQVFTDDHQKDLFVQRMQNKNTMPIFKTDISAQDQFLTFSTCYGPAGTTKRLVVQAKLIAEQDSQPVKKA